MRFRVCDRRYPGKPDIVVPKSRTIIDIRGCFWHRHGCKDSTMPKSNIAFWMEKWSKNVRRDIRNEAAWREDGWSVIVIWQCALEGAKAERTLARIAAKVETWSSEVSRGVVRASHTGSKSPAARSENAKGLDHPNGRWTAAAGIW